MMPLCLWREKDGVNEDNSVPTPKSNGIVEDPEVGFNLCHFEQGLFPKVATIQTSWNTTSVELWPQI